jgi:hypothetical protein
MNNDLERIMKLSGLKLDEDLQNKRLPAKNFEPNEEDYPDEVVDDELSCPNCGASGGAIKYHHILPNKHYCASCDQSFNVGNDKPEPSQMDWDEKGLYNDEDPHKYRDYDYDWDYDDLDYDGWKKDGDTKQGTLKFESLSQELDMCVESILKTSGMKLSEGAFDDFSFNGEGIAQVTINDVLYDINVDYDSYHEGYDVEILSVTTRSTDQEGNDIGLKTINLPNKGAELEDRQFIDKMYNDYGMELELLNHDKLQKLGKEAADSFHGTGDYYGGD